MSDRSPSTPDRPIERDAAVEDADLPEQDRSVERTKAFTDAVVAIALTLLVLPLLDGVPEAVREQVTVGQWAHEHLADGAFFAMSFALISRYWQGHEHIFRYTQHMSSRMFRVNALWMFGIAWMPLGTALLSARSDQAQLVLYIAPMLLCAVCQTLLALMTGREPGSTMPSRLLANTMANALLMGLALLLALGVQQVLIPGWHGMSFTALFALLFTSTCARRLGPRAHRLLHRTPASDVEGH